jgi:hypothetical protein
MSLKSKYWALLVPTMLEFEMKTSLEFYNLYSKTITKSTKITTNTQCKIWGSILGASERLERGRERKKI